MCRLHDPHHGGQHSAYRVRSQVDETAKYYPVYYYCRLCINSSTQETALLCTAVVAGVVLRISV